MNTKYYCKSKSCCTKKGTDIILKPVEKIVPRGTLICPDCKTILVVESGGKPFRHIAKKKSYSNGSMVDNF